MVSRPQQQQALHQRPRRPRPPRSRKLSRPPPVALRRSRSPRQQRKYGRAPRERAAGFLLIPQDLTIGQMSHSKSQSRPRCGGLSARTAKNMDVSLTVPTATSVRSLPVKLLIDQRVVINNHLRRARGGKVSYTHIIGYAMVQALKTIPAMNNGYDVIDGKPTLVVPAHVNLGLAIDLPKEDGTRQLLVPSIKRCETLDFAQFWSGYEQMVKKARAGKLTLEDFRWHHDYADQSGNHRHQPLGPALDAGSRRDHRRGLHGVPAGVPGVRPRSAQRHERIQDPDADVDV